MPAKVTPGTQMPHPPPRRERIMSTPSAEDRALTIDIAKLALEKLAPDELAILPEVADDFFRHPDQVTRNAREESLGFGIELALLTPFVLSVTVEVVKFLL